MKTNTLIKTLLGALVAITFAVQAQAGPGSLETYAPVKTMKQAEAIKPGDRIAISCGNCGVTSITVADKDRSYLHGFTCATCKKKFTVRDNGHGQQAGEFVYEDDLKHTATLLQKM